ncbi:MAG: hypothetical protein F4X02_00760 [Chloroflexi bacterium]|nr:hypothetical protein [Chloroflexota bacterium]
MTTPKPTPATPVASQREETELEPLTEAQREFMDDLRVSLIQMKNGDVMPALEALREIEREIELEENGSRPDA